MIKKQSKIPLSLSLLERERMIEKTRLSLVLFNLSLFEKEGLREIILWGKRK